MTCRSCSLHVAAFARCTCACHDTTSLWIAAVETAGLQQVPTTGATAAAGDTSTVQLLQGQYRRAAGSCPEHLFVDSLSEQSGARAASQPAASVSSLLVALLANDQACLRAARCVADVAAQRGAQRGVEQGVHSGVDGVHDEGDGCSRGGDETGVRVGGRTAEFMGVH